MHATTCSHHSQLWLSAHNDTPTAETPYYKNPDEDVEIDDALLIRADDAAVCRRFGDGVGLRSSPPERLRGEDGGSEEEAAEVIDLRLPPPPPYWCISWCVRLKRVPHALHRMGLHGGPFLHCGESARHRNGSGICHQPLRRSSLRGTSSHPGPSSMTDSNCFTSSTSNCS